MSYLALARKWRPGTFADLVGQSHVVRALTNSLESDRVHHAYLFSGTRGVGKTTIARILAKALNCENGVVAEPCGKCSACLAIDEGRFVDLIEVDAASRTKVDDTRELLENVQYAPTNARYKVYLIDEVHMLSNSSFNALLKTLEEPPPHVKFLLATTDPQKLPVTVLSRCLQFNLKRLPTALMSDRMAKICSAEGLTAEPAALTRLARAASGSMRDALSLLDQGLVFGGNELNDNDTAEMLGSLDQKHIGNLLDALISADATELIARIRALDELVPDYASVLSDLASALQQIAVIQLAGAAALDPDMDNDALEGIAGQLDAELVQLYYEIACAGRRDISLAPEPRLGFEMSLLRMLAFSRGPGVLASDGGGGSTPAKAPVSKPAVTKQKPSTPSAAPTSTRSAAKAISAAPVLNSSEDWLQLVAGLGLSGMAGELAKHCALVSFNNGVIALSIDAANEALLTDNMKGRMQDALQACFSDPLKLLFEPCAAQASQSADTIAQRHEDAKQQQLDTARDAINGEAAVQDLIKRFDATVDASSIVPNTGK
ncbi:MAG: DNA polymerase III subunit gamma/tau [Gammaproteobacteria bacterium]|nr:DNA polymerase III subunit gamma/tau [Gammaproteobacteria bacterium]